MTGPGQYPPEVLDAAAVVIEYLKNTAWPCVFTQTVEIPLSLVDAAMEKRNSGLTPMQLMEIWNTMKSPRLAKCSMLTAARRRQCNARLKEFPKRETWVEFIKVLSANRWATGQRPSAGHPNWKANFDFFIKPGSVVKFVEGGFREEYQRPASAREMYGEDLERRSGEAPRENEGEAEIDEDRPNG